jgi:hypothetical protein
MSTCGLLDPSSYVDFRDHPELPGRIDDERIEEPDEARHRPHYNRGGRGPGQR